jgi:RNA polymerase primary sigma factor/RNA polymerase sigma factor
MGKISKRVESLLNLNIKVFYHPDFDNKEKIDHILGEIPNKDIFEKEKIKSDNLRKENKTIEMRPFYEEPLLTKEQEYHLFKKMNYYKYQCKKLIDFISEQKPTIKIVREIERMLQNYLNIRNQIANSNFRLASYILTNDFKRNTNTYNKAHECNSEFSLSDAFLDVIKSVDYFNYTLGNKFSTYCIWVIKNNFFRGIKLRKMKAEPVVYTIENYFTSDEICEDAAASNEDFELELHQKENALYINKIIRLVKFRFQHKDVRRQIKIVEEYYGLNGRKRKNLEEISGRLGITKERVRQLKEKFLFYMRETINDNGKEYVV